MNYRHGFHAGNFADVHKHVVLLELLRHLHKKTAPFVVLDTHAGRGLYDLRSTEAERGNEWQGGIGQLLAGSFRSPLLTGYADAVRNLSGSTSKAYPGSPLFIASMLREGDRAIFVEKQPQEAAALRDALAGRRRIAIEEGDGYAALLAHLPPKENRGLVLIDPPYEAELEFATLAAALLLALRRWPNGMYCVWYPIKASAAELRLHRTLTDAGIKKMLLAEVNVRPADSPLGLNGSGLLIVNPPWQLDEQLRNTLPALQSVLADEHGSHRVEWLAGE